MSAQVPPAQLVGAGALEHDFRRTASRLIEMQSREYSGAARRPTAGAPVPETDPT